jgi:hypothetical protein
VYKRNNDDKKMIIVKEDASILKTLAVLIEKLPLYLTRFYCSFLMGLGY